MCIIVNHTAKSKILDRKIFNNCWRNNSDGAGLMYSYNNKLIIKKSMRKKEFWNMYIKSFREGEPMILHFRIGTSGKTHDLTCCHPFSVNDDLAFVHNGVISIETTPEKSDTMVFNEGILQGLPTNFEDNEVIRILIKEYIRNSKLVFMDNEGSVTIINEVAGYWDTDTWYSNKSYEVPRASKPTYNFIGGSQVGFGNRNYNTADDETDWDAWKTKREEDEAREAIAIAKARDAEKKEADKGELLKQPDGFRAGDSMYNRCGECGLIVEPEALRKTDFNTQICNDCYNSYLLDQEEIYLASITDVVTEPSDIIDTATEASNIVNIHEDKKKEQDEALLTNVQKIIYPLVKKFMTKKEQKGEVKRLTDQSKKKEVLT